MIQNFLAKANEIAALDANIPSKKKNKNDKNERNEKNLLLEKIDLLKKKIDTENFFAAVQIKLLFNII